MRIPPLILIGALLAASTAAAETKTYTDKFFLYSVDYPQDWKVKHISKFTVITSPFESKEDRFAENVEIVAEDVSQVPGGVNLFEYYRKSSGGAADLLPDFKLLEEAQTVWNGREAIVNLYTMTHKGERFKRKAYTFLIDKTAYVLTYTAKLSDFEAYLAPAERIIRSIRVSP